MRLTARWAELGQIGDRKGSGRLTTECKTSPGHGVRAEFRSQAWWALGFEATGPANMLCRALEAAAAQVFSETVPGGWNWAMMMRAGCAGGRAGEGWRTLMRQQSVSQCLNRPPDT